MASARIRIAGVNSKYMCQELIQRGVLEQAVYLFEGGWEKWLEEEMPYVEGDE